MDSVWDCAVDLYIKNSLRVYPGDYSRSTGVDVLLIGIFQGFFSGVLQWFLGLFQESGIRDNVFCFYRVIYTKNPSGAVLPRDLVLKGAASYSPALHCSTIGAIGLNFSVRNGKRWNTDAIATQRGLTLLTGKM